MSTYRATSSSPLPLIGELVEKPHTPMPTGNFQPPINICLLGFPEVWASIATPKGELFFRPGYKWANHVAELTIPLNY
jgi:hypothetical protein